MSDETHPDEGKVVASAMSHVELAELSPPRETEGEVPQATKQYDRVSFEDVEASCKEADDQADDRDADGEEE